MFNFTRPPNILEELIASNEDWKRQQCLAVLEVFKLKLVVEKEGKFSGLTVVDINV